MDAINPAPVCYIPSARRWKHLRAHFQQGHKPQLQQSCSGNTVAWRCHNGGRRDCQKVEYSSAAARSVVGSKRGRFEPSTAAKPSENRGRMPMTPGPILNALSPLLWVRTAESQPSACLTPCIGSRPASPSLRTGPTFSSHGLCGSGSSRQRPPVVYRPYTSHFLRISAGAQHQPYHHPLAPSRNLHHGHSQWQFPSKAKTRQFHCPTQWSLKTPRRRVLAGSRAVPSDQSRVVHGGPVAVAEAPPCKGHRVCNHTHETGSTNPWIPPSLFQPWEIMGRGVEMKGRR